MIFSLKGSKSTIIETFKTNRQFLDKNISIQIERFKFFKKNEISKYTEFFNAHLYTSLCYRDVVIVLERLILAKTSTEKSVFLRTLALVIVEYLNDVNTLLGKKLKNELQQNDLHEFIPIIKLVNKEFSTLLKQHSLILRLIRNNTLAHKSKDALQLVKYIEDIDEKEIIKLAMELTNTITKLISATTDIELKIQTLENEKLRKHFS